MSDNNNQNANPYPPAQNNNLAEQGHSVNLRFLFNKYILRHWYLYVYTLTLALITAYFYNWYATPIYFSSSFTFLRLSFLSAISHSVCSGCGRPTKPAIFPLFRLR